MNALSTIYGRVARMRRSWYERHPQSRRSLERPVISVGNLSVGGSGKTPVVAALARLLLTMGQRPAILSRGYARRRSSDGVVVVSDGARVLEPVENSGDEPQMLARTLPNVPVLVCTDRHLAGRLAERRFGATVMLLAQDLDMAADLIDRALRLDPHSAWAWIRSGYVQAYRGDAETALAHFERAQRLSPFDPFNFNLYVGFALAHFIAERYEQACEWAERGLRERPDLPWAYRVLAAAHPYLGNVERSRWAAARVREANPQISVARVMASLPLRSADASARFAEGLRRAGLPESAPAGAGMAEAMRHEQQASAALRARKER